MSEYVKYLNCETKDIGRYVILIENAADCEKISTLLKNTNCALINREFKIITGEINSEKVSVVSSGIGSPSAAIAIEELAVCGVDTVIRIGNASPISPNSALNDLILATAGIKLDGTSAQYVSSEFPAVANFTVIRMLEQAATRSLGKFGFKMGITESRDAFYRPKCLDSALAPNNFALDRAWTKAGVLCSDMETSAVFIVSRILGIRAASINIISNDCNVDIMPCAQIACDGIKLLIEYDKIPLNDCLLT